MLAGVLLARCSRQGVALAWSGRRAADLGSVVAIIGAWVYGVSASTRLGWDAGTVTGTAAVLAGGSDLDAAQVDYFAQFPNNVPLLALETLLIRAGGLVGLPARDMLLAWQVLLVGVIVWSLGRTACLLGHPVRGVAVQLAALVLLGLSPQALLTTPIAPRVRAVATTAADSIAPSASQVPSPASRQNG